MLECDLLGASKGASQSPGSIDVVLVSKTTPEAKKNRDCLSKVSAGIAMGRKDTGDGRDDCVRCSGPSAEKKAGMGVLDRNSCVVNMISSLEPCSRHARTVGAADVLEGSEAHTKSMT